ncbi:MAG TPA: hypothetical protein VD905_14995 [Flavobacteriales bacterium]|nr:hypothetical protein [Flavobacteriales bacterium]
MKFFLPIIILLSSFAGVNAQKKAVFNGWEFLEWGTDRAQVQKIINGKKLRYPNALDAAFRYNENLNTWLDYDSLKRLNRVKQRITFGIHEQKQAGEAYEKIRARMFSDYGIPRMEMRDTTENNTHTYWNLNHTKIHLEYDYQYKIIDEFGAGSYWVEIVFEKAD